MFPPASFPPPDGTETSNNLETLMLQRLVRRTAPALVASRGIASKQVAAALFFSPFFTQRACFPSPGSRRVPGAAQTPGGFRQSVSRWRQQRLRAAAERSSLPKIRQRGPQWDGASHGRASASPHFCLGAGNFSRLRRVAAFQFCLAEQAAI